MSEVIAGRYRIERELGKGGMATVFEVTDLESADQRVALKRLHPSFAGDRAIVARFEREARAVMALKSEHAVRVYGVGETDRGVPFIAMELLSGFDLAKVRKEALTRPEAQSVDWILQAIHAIAEAHACGIVHRDVKPHNLFVTRDADGSDVVKVLDFGIAKAVATSDGQVTRSEEIIGSPSYMSPEQTKASKDVDERTDIWALGVCLYELLTGMLPFEADSVAEIYSKILVAEPASLRTHRPAIAPELASVVMKCLQKDRAARWPDVAALSDALEPFGSPASAGAAQRIRDILRVRFEATAPPTPYSNAGPSPAVAEDLQVTLPMPPRPRGRARMPLLVVGGAIAVVAVLVGGFVVTRRELEASAPTPAASASEEPFDETPLAASASPVSSATPSEPVELAPETPETQAKPSRATHGRPRRKPVHPSPTPSSGAPAARY